MNASPGCELAISLNYTFYIDTFFVNSPRAILVIVAPRKGATSSCGHWARALASYQNEGLSRV